MQCPSGPLSARFETTLPRNGGHDADVLGEAVLIETNRSRCSQGVAPLAGNAALQQAAGLHSQDMARERFFSHDSPVRGRETLAARVTQVGFRFQRVAENIIESRYMAYRYGAPYQVIDAVRCEFSYADGEKIRPHTYATLAREVVTRWMESPGHRGNILTPDLRAHGFALAPNADSSLCGGIYATQVMAR
ncbi:MAG: CAP domain-containing protein [Pseudomonadota bacterium]